MYLKKFNLYLLTGQFLPVYPVYVLLFQHSGLSLMSISLLFMIWSIPGLLLEVPSSILADRWNRRNMLIIGRTFKCLCFMIWGIYSNFTGFAVGFLLWGAGGAMTSGTEEAWLYDALKIHGLASEYDKQWGKSSFHSQLAVAASSILGSLIAMYDLNLTIWLSVAMMLLSLLLAASLPEFNQFKTDSNRTQTIGNPRLLTTLSDGLRFCRRHQYVPLLIGFSVLVIVTAGVLDEYDQLIVRSMGVPLGLVGTWLMLRYLMEAMGCRTAWRMKLFFEKIGLITPFSQQLCLACIAGLLLCMTALLPFLWLLPVYGLYYYLFAGAKILFTDSLQQAIEHQGRATVQSLAAMLEAPGGILIYTLFGAVGQVFGLQAAMLAISLWVFCCCMVFLFLFKATSLASKTIE